MSPELEHPEFEINEEPPEYDEIVEISVLLFLLGQINYIQLLNISMLTSYLATISSSEILARNGVNLSLQAGLKCLAKNY